MKQPDKLEKQVANARRLLEHLEQARTRRSGGLPCPQSEDHVGEVLHVVAGGLGSVVTHILERYNMKITGGFGGYQVVRCLACHQYFLRNYFGDFVSLVNETDAKVLITGKEGEP